MRKGPEGWKVFDWFWLKLNYKVTPFLFLTATLYPWFFLPCSCPARVEMRMGFNTQGKMVHWQLGEWRNADAGIYILIFQHHRARRTPPATGCRVYLLTQPKVWLAWCIPSHLQQYGRAECIQHGRAGCIPVHCQQYGRAGSIPSHRQQCGRAGCIHFHRQHMEVQGVFISIASIWKCRVYPFPSPAYGSAGCIHFHRQ